MGKPMTTDVVDLDAETQATIDELMKPQWMEITGNTLNVGPLIARKVMDAEERKAALVEQTVDERRHRERYERFCSRLATRPRLVEKRPYLSPMLHDIRWWEAGQARVDLSDTRLVGRRRESVSDWFWGLPDRARVALVKIEQERRALERRFRLKNKGPITISKNQFHAVE